MSIDGNVIDSCRMDDGTVALHIHQPDPKRIAGQQWLYILNPDVGTIPIGTHIWGCSSVIMSGDKRIAMREGYTGIRMIPMPDATPEETPEERKSNDGE